MCGVVWQWLNMPSSLSMSTSWWLGQIHFSPRSNNKNVFRVWVFTVVVAAVGLCAILFSSLQFSYCINLCRIQVLFEIITNAKWLQSVYVCVWVIARSIVCLCMIHRSHLKSLKAVVHNRMGDILSLEIMNKLQVPRKLYGIDIIIMYHVNSLYTIRTSSLLSHIYQHQLHTL